MKQFFIFATVALTFSSGLAQAKLTYKPATQVCTVTCTDGTRKNHYNVATEDACISTANDQCGKNNWRIVYSNPYQFEPVEAWRVEDQSKISTLP